MTRRVDFLQYKYYQHFCFLASHYSSEHLVIFQRGVPINRYPKKDTLYTILDQEALFLSSRTEVDQRFFLGKVERISFLGKICPIIDPLHFKKNKFLFFFYHRKHVQGKNTIFLNNSVMLRAISLPESCFYLNRML